MRKGIRQVRLCKYCGDKVKENWSTGVFKGYYRTCGKPECKNLAGFRNPFYGKKHPKHIMDKIPLFKKGMIPWNKGKKGLQTNKFIREYNRQRTGDKHHRWKGGITPWYQKIRTSEQYNQWRKEVYERDKYVCQKCGVSGNGINLEAHHIKSFSRHPDLRFSVDNGLTLCVSCHKLTDNYAGRTR